MLILNNNILEKCIGLICPNNTISSYVLSNQESLSQQTFLQKKRSLENNNLIQPNENSQCPNSNNNGQILYYPEFYKENHLFTYKSINPVYNDVNQLKFGDISNYCIFIVNNNIIEQKFFNNNNYNINCNFNGEYFNNYLATKYSFENRMENINKINNINSRI